MEKCKKCVTCQVCVTCQGKCETCQVCIEAEMGVPSESQPQPEIQPQMSGSVKEALLNISKALQMLAQSMPGGGRTCPVPSKRSRPGQALLPPPANTRKVQRRRKEIELE